jgi:anti-sigma factor RsiW
VKGHAGERLIPLLRGELPEDEARAIQAHVDGCADCRRDRAEVERLALDLSRAEAPPVHWGAYRAELEDKLAGRLGPPGPAAGRRWLWPPLPATLAAGLVALLLYMGLPAKHGQAPIAGDPAGLENAILASRLDLISRLDLVQRLDLLEDLDVIRGLDRLAPRGES